MAQLNITLNQEEILQLLRESSPDAFKNLLQESLNRVGWLMRMKACNEQVDNEVLRLNLKRGHRGNE